jgi:hypothetical protein
MGEIQHGTYDDECEGLTYEEINALYGFGENGEQECSEQEDDGNEESEVDMDSDIEACLSQNKLIVNQFYLFEQEDNGNEASEADMESDDERYVTTDSDHGLDSDLKAGLL